MSRQQPRHRRVTLAHLITVEPAPGPRITLRGRPVTQIAYPLAHVPRRRAWARYEIEQLGKAGEL